MKWVSRKSAAALGVALSLLASSCSSDSSDEENESDGGGHSGTLTAAWDAAPESWEPGADNIDGMMRVPYETLIRRGDAAGEFEPVLATSWEVTDESVTLELRDDVTFHDGTAFNAEAVKVNLEYVQEQGGPFSGYLSSIEAINVVDDYTVELALSRPDPAIEISLASRAGFMASPAAIEDQSIVEAPVGTGPWAFNADDSTAGSTWVFDAYDDYYDPDGFKVARIELVGMSDTAARFAALQTGEVDIAEHPAGEVAQAEAAGLTTELVPGTHIGVLMIDRGPGGKLEDLETRRAVCSAVDNEAYGLVGGEGARTMVDQRFGEGDYGYNPDIVGYDLDEELAGTAAGLDLTIGIFDGAAEDATALAGEYAKHGINLDVQIVPAAKYFADWYKDWDIGLGDNTELHPYLWYATWFAADAPNNVSGVESPELKAAADAAMAAGTTPEAEPLWQEVMRIIDEEALICTQFDFNFVAAWDPDRVKNVELTTFQIADVDYRKIEVVDE